MTRQVSRRSISVRSRRARPITVLASRPDGRVSCDVCPRFCKLHEGQEILCVVRAPREGRIVLTTYGRSNGYCIDPIDKKPLNDFLPETPVVVLRHGRLQPGLQVLSELGHHSKPCELDTLADEAAPEAIAEAAVRLGCRSVAYAHNDPSSLLNCRAGSIRFLYCELPLSSMRLGVRQSKSSSRDRRCAAAFL